MTPPLHPDADAILRRLKENGVKNFYHFTNVQNLAAICEMEGLCSKQLLELQGKWPCNVPGGEELSHSLYDGTRKLDRSIR